MAAEAPILDGYTGLTQINSGGSSRIYSAHDERNNRNVAVKVLTTKSLDLTIQQSFAREIKAMERVSDHPHIMGMYDSGFTADGTPYMVMPLYTDGSYADRIKSDGPIHWVETVDVGIKIASALQAAHERHVLHRDIKPANIFVGHFRTDPILGDFGIATVVGEGKTTTVAVAYTLTYVAPEVLNGNRQTRQSDIYSLGVTLRQFLTGRPAFAAETSAGLVAQILSFPPVPLMLELSADLVDLLDAMVAKDPLDRPDDAGEVAAALQTIQQSRASVSATEISELEIDGPDDVLGSDRAGGCDVTLLYGSELDAPSESEPMVPTEPYSPTRRFEQTTQVPHRFTLSKTQTLDGHDAAINAVSFSPDGTLLATASDDRTVMFWDTTSGEPRLTIDGHQGWVNDVSFSPDGSTAATASDDENIKVWNVDTGQLLHTLANHSSTVNSVAFSPDGATLASASFDGSVMLWDVAQGQLRQTLGDALDLNSVHSVAYRSDGFALATGSFDGTLILWDAESGQKQLTIEDHADWITSVAFSPDGNRLATASADGSVMVRDAITGQKQFVLQGFADRVTSLAFAANSETLASVNVGGLALWDAATGEQHTVKLNGSAGSQGVPAVGADNAGLIAFDPSGSKVVVVGDSVVVWSVDSSPLGPSLKAGRAAERLGDG